MNKFIYSLLLIFVGFTVACTSGGEKEDTKTNADKKTETTQKQQNTPPKQTPPTAPEGQAEKEQELIKKHIADNSWTDVQSTPSGLHYKITKEGTGAYPTLQDAVVVNCRGTLLNGKEFWAGKDVEFPLGRVIPGWQEGIPKMKKGSSATFLIPSAMAYGVMGTPDGSVPPNSVLVFEVDLLDIHAPGHTHDH